MRSLQNFRPLAVALKHDGDDADCRCAPGTRSAPGRKGRRMRVLVIDDSSFMRRVLSKLIEADPDLVVIGTADNGVAGLEQITALKPDVVTLDIQMPRLNGLGVLQELADRGTPAPPILVCSSLTAEGTHEALEAMRLGAADFITKDAVKAASSDPEFSRSLTSTIKHIAQAGKRRRQAGARPVESPMEPTRGADGGANGRVVGGEAAVACGALSAALPATPALKFILVIGTSTGGPPVLEATIGALPAKPSFPVVVAQHMPAAFTASLAERLDRLCAPRVVHASDNLPLEAGTVYIGEGGKNVRVVTRDGRQRLEVNRLPETTLYRPSADELFRSVSGPYRRACTALVLSGMGNDGAAGAAAIQAAGGRVFTQTEASCVVYGMPKAV
ncbi:MAG: chemotaxis-specific protein-glutamate methyltransferase CheB, partial [Planctomycetota bacterium]